MDVAKPFANTSPTVISWKEDSCDVGTVEVAGTFSSWSPLPMARSSCGMWTLRLDLSQGRHEYKILVDGDWRIDDSVSSVPNDMGSSNNVLEVVDPVQEKASDGVETCLEGTSPSQVEAEEARSPTRSGKRPSFSKKSDTKATSTGPKTKKAGCHLEENPLLMSPITRGRLARVTAGGVKMSCGMNIGAKSQSMNPHSAHTQVMAAKLVKEGKVQPSKTSVANGGRAPIQKGTAVNNGRFQATKSAVVNNVRSQPSKGSLVNNGKSTATAKAEVTRRSFDRSPTRSGKRSSFSKKSENTCPVNVDRLQQPKGSMENGKRPVVSTSSMVGLLKPKNQETKARSQPIPCTTRPVGKQAPNVPKTGRRNSTKSIDG